jgi:hypothetical protein
VLNSWRYCNKICQNPYHSNNGAQTPYASGHNKDAIINASTKRRKRAKGLGIVLIKNGAVVSNLGWLSREENLRDIYTNFSHVGKARLSSNISGLRICPIAPLQANSTIYNLFS